MIIKCLIFPKANLLKIINLTTIYNNKTNFSKFKIYTNVNINIIFNLFF